MAFVSYYNYRCYHKTLSNATPSDVLQGRREEFLRRRKEVQAQTTKGGGASTGPSESSVLTLDNDNSLGSRSVPLLLINNSWRSNQCSHCVGIGIFNGQSRLSSSLTLSTAVMPSAA